MDDDLREIEARAKGLPKEKALEALLQLTAYEHRQAAHCAVAALSAWSNDIGTILTRRGETDTMLRVKVQELASEKNRLMQILAAPDAAPSPDEETIKSAIRSMEDQIAGLKKVGADHAEWLASVLRSLNAERAFVESLRDQSAS